MKVGDRVRVSGYAWSQPISRGLRATEFNKLDEAKFVEPIELDHTQLRDPENNYTLITLDVEVMDIGRSFKGNEKGSATQTSFLCRAGEEVFECKIPTHYIENKKVLSGYAFRGNRNCKFRTSNRCAMAIFYRADVVTASVSR